MFATLGEPPAIVWTSGSTSPSLRLASASSVDIQAIQTWNEREREFAAIRGFSENWDGYGSAPPSPPAMEAAAFFLHAWKEKSPDNPPARIALSPEGLLAVEWMEGSALVRAEIQDSNEVEWMSAMPGQSAEFFTTPLMNLSGLKTQQEQTWQPTPGVEELALAYAR